MISVFDAYSSLKAKLAVLVVFNATDHQEQTYTQ